VLISVLCAEEVSVLLVGLADPRLEVDTRAVAECGQFGDAEKLARGSVWLRGVEDKPSPTADDIAVSLASATSVPVPMLIGSSSDWTRFGDGIPLRRARDAMLAHPNSHTCPAEVRD
jgi:hypothetical protein